MTATCKATVVPRERWGGFHSHVCGRPANDPEFAELCKIHGNARRKGREGSQRRATERELSEAAEARAEATIALLTGYGLPNAELARPALEMTYGRKLGGYTGGIELTEEQAEWLLRCFANGAEDS